MSLQRRLGLGIGASLALVLLAVWVAVGWSTRRLSEDYVASRLEHDAESLLAALTLTPTPTLNTEAVSAVYRRPYSGHYYTVATGSLVLRSRSLWDETLNLATTGEARTARLTGPRDQTLLIYARRYTRDGVPVDIAVAEDLAPMERSIDAFQRALGLIFLVAVLLVLAGTRLGIRQGLAPLDRLRHEVGRIERGEAAGLSAAAPAEVAPLVEAINRLLRLTAQRLARSRTALGDLAHALKTPLALILQTADDPANAMAAPARARLRSEAERIYALIERELGRARVAGAAGPGQRFRPADDVPALLEVIRGLYADRHLAIAQSVPARSYAVDREDMLELLGNLLDNAAKWARGRLQVTVADAADLRLCVEDDGPGCSGDDLAQITGRGVRLDETVPGSGLGLSIVRAIVDSYGGTLTLGRSEALGGLRVEVRFPAHPG
jgi:signal transduction histidine kinase